MFTAVITLEAQGASSTKYTARAIHANAESAAAHAAMGFDKGWGAALDQLVALVKASPAT